MTNSAPLGAAETLPSEEKPCGMQETKKELPPPATSPAPSDGPRQDATGTHGNVAVPAPFSAPPGGFRVLVDGVRFAPQCLVYGLVDPREPERVRYVGKTTKGALVRYLAHLMGQGNGIKRSVWLRKLATAKHQPHMVLLERVARAADLGARERWWIAAMQAVGQADTNAPAPNPATQQKRDLLNARRRGEEAASRAYCDSLRVRMEARR